jgi:UDP-glucose 4-epimerase
MTQQAVLITGSTGEIGHGLIKFLSNEGKHHVVALDVQGDPTEYNRPGVEFLQSDILDTAFLDSLFERYDFQAIFHLAGVLSTGAEKNPSKAQAVNVTGSFNLIERASKQSEKLGRSTYFIFPSTIAVHGIPDSKTKAAAGQVNEDQFLTPIGIYGVNKL